MHLRANTVWTIPTGTVSYDQARLAVLMDIRCELNQLNNLLQCPNFLNLPHDIAVIKANTTPEKPRSKKAGK
jgi:hypothetical protein